MSFTADNSTSELEKKIFHLKTLYDVSQEIVFLKSTQDIISNLLLMIMGVFGITKVFFFLMNDEENRIEVYSERGITENIIDDVEKLFET